ncbi:MAG: helix-turn-helix domain-containing protein [Oliverpabstia sp.]
MEINVECGKRLKRARMENGYSQVDFAEITHYSKQTICYIENGKRPLCPDAAQLFAKKLGVREEYLLCEDDFKTVDDLLSVKELRSRLWFSSWFKLFFGTEYDLTNLENGNFAITSDKERKICTTKELEHLHETLNILEETKKNIIRSFIDTCSLIDNENNKQLEMINKQKDELNNDKKIRDFIQELDELPDIPFE